MRSETAFPHKVSLSAHPPVVTRTTRKHLCTRLEMSPPVKGQASLSLLGREGHGEGEGSNGH